MDRRTRGTAGLARLARASAALALLILVATSARAQYYERTIPLPDSTCGIGEPGCFVYIPSSNLIYVGGAKSEGLLVIDPVSRQKVKWIRTGQGV